MKRFVSTCLRSLVDIRPGEGRRTALLFVYYLLVLFAYYILKPVARALFLDTFDADRLPWLYILMALLGGAGASWTARSAAQERLTSVIAKSQVFLLSNILFIWWLLQFQSPIVLYIFSIWVGTFSIITVGQFWLLANNFFDTRSARRLLPLIGVAAVLGGVLGGMFTSVLVHVIGARNLVLVCGLLIGLTAIIVRALGGHEQPGRTRAEMETRYHARDTLALVWRSEHLRSISLLVSFMFIVDTLVDYQFSVLAKQTYSGLQLMAFLATFQGVYLNVASFALQLFLTGPVLRLLGVGGALGFAPAGVAVGGLAMLVHPSLLGAGIMKATEAASRYTFTRTGLELLYLPIPRELKNRTKLFLEVFVDRLSRGIAGGLLLLCTVVLAMDVREVTLLTLAFVAAWIIAVIFVWRSYVSTLRRSIEKREVRFDEEMIVHPADKATRCLLLQSVESPNERQVAYALYLLEQLPRIPITRQFPRLLRHSSPDVRAATFRLLAAWRDPAALSEASQAVQDEDEAIRQEALYYVCQCDGDPVSRLQDFLHDASMDVRFAALSVAEKYSYPRRLPAVSDGWIQELLRRPSGEGSERARALAAAALAFADIQCLPVTDYLRDLLADGSPSVVNAAIRTAGKLQETELVPLLLQGLLHRTTRVEAREALEHFGVRLVPTLLQPLNDPRAPEALRQQVPRLLAAIAGPEAAGALIRHLPSSTALMRFQILKALNRIRRDHPNLHIPGEVIDAEIVQEAKRYYELLLSMESDPGEQADGRRLLVRSLEERLDQTLERIFRLLGLRYPPDDIYDVYRAVRSPESQRRAAAVEFLDNLLDQPLKRIILRIVEESSWDRLTPLGGELFGLELLSPESCLTQLMRGDDPWLKMVAINRAGELQLRSLEGELRQAKGDADPLVSETASRAISLLNQHVGLGGEV